MEATMAPDSNEPLTFEKVWAMFQESGKRMEEDFKRHEEDYKRHEEENRQRREQFEEENRQSRERFEEESRQFREQQRLTDLQIKRTERLVAKLSKNVGGLNRSMGELIEILIAARLWEKFSGYPYNLKRAYQRIPIYDEKNYVRTDIDILLVDTEWAMAVEVKRELRESDIEYHTKRMGLITQYPPAEVKGKKLLGAIAAGVVPPDLRDLAYSNGYFVLELSGESVALLPPPEGFTPKEW
ncbi:MAG: hypothetical protein LBD48_07400 [Treponema sp.]|nr:hypothetical protein [Treponema sp.]